MSLQKRELEELIPRLPKSQQQPALDRLRWLNTARREQLPPPGDWRVWYLRGGRGAGKTRTGAETLARWIWNHDPGEWAIVAPTFGDARAVCTEGTSGLLKALGGMVQNWNRSEGVIEIHGGSRVFLDGADDGALRIQGHNLRGAWADEVGLWREWERAWNESIRPAVRHEPGLIVATGTPKMAHPLVGHLLASPHVVETHMRTIDNVENLDRQTVEELYAQYAGSTLGRQELEGEYIEALEGSILSRHDWRWFDCRSNPVDRETAKRLPRFDVIVHTWDTAVKGKTSSDPVAGQVWGVAGPDRYLLRVWSGQASFDATIVHMAELRDWSAGVWPTTPQVMLIETAANGRDAIDTMRRRVDGVHEYNPRDGGDKVRRALSASPALETGHCWLPGFADPDPNGRGYHSSTPPEVQAFVEECSQFRGDMKHKHDDQVDAWSQMVNWTRLRSTSKAKVTRGRGRVPRAGSIVGAGR